MPSSLATWAISGGPSACSFRLGYRFFQLPEQIGIKLQAQIGVVAALQQQLFAAELKGFLDLLFVFLDGR